MFITDMNLILGAPPPVSFFDRLIVQSIFALLSVPISAIILRQAISMFNSAAITKAQTIQMPSLLKAIEISFLVTIVFQVLTEIIIIAFDPESNLIYTAEKIYKTSLVPTLVTSLILGFFTYSGLLSHLLSIRFDSAMKVVMYDFIVRAISIVFCGFIGFILSIIISYAS